MKAAEGSSASHLTLLGKTLKQHRLSQCKSVDHKFRRPSQRTKAQGAPREFLWVAPELQDGRVVLKEGLGIEHYPYASGVGSNTAPPLEKSSVVAGAHPEDYSAQGAAAASNKGRGYARAPPTRQAPPIPLFPFQPHVDISIGVAVESRTPVSPHLEATLRTVYSKLVLPSAPLTIAMMITTLMRTMSWWDASAATLQMSEILHFGSALRRSGRLRVASRSLSL